MFIGVLPKMPVAMRDYEKTFDTIDIKFINILREIGLEKTDIQIIINYWNQNANIRVEGTRSKEVTMQRGSGLV